MSGSGAGPGWVRDDLMTIDAGVAYKSRKYALCSLKAECTNMVRGLHLLCYWMLTNLSLIERYTVRLGWSL